jgi:hypothetical protein
MVCRTLPPGASRLLKNYCATLIQACAVLEILMYSLCTLRFLRSGRTPLKTARDVFLQPARCRQDPGNSAGMEGLIKRLPILCHRARGLDLSLRDFDGSGVAN